MDHTINIKTKIYNIFKKIRFNLSPFPYDKNYFFFKKNLSNS